MISVATSSTFSLLVLAVSRIAVTACLLLGHGNSLITSLTSLLDAFSVVCTVLLYSMQEMVRRAAAGTRAEAGQEASKKQQEEHQAPPTTTPSQQQMEETEQEEDAIKTTRKQGVGGQQHQTHNARLLVRRALACYCT